jgi:hypothetical protein
MNVIGFDLISDLNLSRTDQFDWSNKATSLYCLIAGNISDDLTIVKKTLLHLSEFYQGIFYTPGSLEYKTALDIQKRTVELHKLCKPLTKVAVLHHHVVIVDGIAIIGSNGWYNVSSDNLIENAAIEECRNEDILYLQSTIERLQKHLDVKKIIMLSSSVPSSELYFGEVPENTKDHLNLSLSIVADTEHKISHWLYGTYEKIVDTTIDGINYLNNGYFSRNPYWAKRVEITI